MISRSLGSEFGGSIGLVFALANVLVTSLEVVGSGLTIQCVARVL
jgi:hypothetical protein